MNPPKGTGPKILFIDIETFPMLGWVWGVYEQNVLKVEKPTVLCCFSAKWHGGLQVTRALPDYKGYKPGKENDKPLMQEIWGLLDQADIVIAQNGDEFDIKMINTEFVKHHMTPPSPYKTVDTLKTARRMFRFPSNKLDDLGADLEEGKKLRTGGKELWFDCMEGDPKAWKRMKRYNAQDVRLLERVYQRFIPWITNHPNYGTFSERPVCPNCGANRLHRSGYKRTVTGRYLQYQCQACGRWCHEANIEKKIKTLR